jgi:1-acyl-sn-glycerol-3-phosphate acyltransferase
MHVRFWAKDTLFQVPGFGRWLRWLGGIPVLRRAPQGVVAPMVQRLREAAERDEFFWLALSPEGTRARTEGWRSGFYQVALGAGVPIGLAYIDYPSRRVGLAGFLQLGGEPASDLAAIAERLAHHRGKRPALAAPIRLGR